MQPYQIYQVMILEEYMIFQKYTKSKGVAYEIQLSAVRAEYVETQ